MDDTRICIDPRTFTEADLPLIVLADDRQGALGWVIREHTSGNWNHSFIMYIPQTIASQGFNLFTRMPIDTYMKDFMMLKFWRIKNLTVAEKQFIITAVKDRLALPWWRRGYDWLGIFGQTINLPFIQNPWQTYCSEETYLDYILPIARAAAVIGKEPNPSGLDAAFKLHPELFECAGYYWQD